MHKLVICLTKAQDRDEAKSNVDEFLEQYGNGDVWDWYVIGGRWSGVLNKHNEEFGEKAKELFGTKYPENDGFISTKMVDENRDGLQAIWESFGATSPNPYNRDSYSTRNNDDDIMPLSECIDIIKKYYEECGDMKQMANEYWEKMLKAKSDEDADPNNKMTMSAYYAKTYADCKNDSFSFESTTYNTDEYTNDVSGALENANEYFAVVVDLHN
jgi:hypothetical protein